jgi:UDP-glucuronate 4-epimerase
MAILVTGGAGFIGSHLCERLLDLGEDVICVDNFDPYYDPATKRLNIHSAKQSSAFKLCEADIRNIGALDSIFRHNRPKTIIHLAARAGVRPSIEDPYIYEEVNVRGTLNLLELSRKYGIGHFIFGSSSSVYGSSTDTPFSEEQHTSAPVSPYAATKKMGEVMCHTYSHLHGMNITALRFFTVYGPRGRPDMAPYLFTKWIHEGSPVSMFGDGTSRRDYTYIDDIVDGISRTLNADLQGCNVINLGNSKTVMLRDFIAVIENAVGKKAKVERLPEQPARTYPKPKNCWAGSRGPT